MKADTVSVHYDNVTGIYILSNPDTKMEVSLPRKLTPEMHKIVRGK